MVGMMEKLLIQMEERMDYLLILMVSLIDLRKMECWMMMMMMMVVVITMSIMMILMMMVVVIMVMMMVIRLLDELLGYRTVP